MELLVEQRASGHCRSGWNLAEESVKAVRGPTAAVTGKRKESADDDVLEVEEVDELLEENADLSASNGAYTGRVKVIPLHNIFRETCRCRTTRSRWYNGELRLLPRSAQTFSFQCSEDPVFLLDFLLVVAEDYLTCLRVFLDSPVASTLAGFVPSVDKVQFPFRGDHVGFQ